MKCFVCTKNYREDSEENIGSVQGKMSNTRFLEANEEFVDKRGISEKTFKSLGYGMGRVPEDFLTATGKAHPMCKKKVHIANYYDPDTGVLVGQKLRDKDKNFVVVGNVTDSLFGMNKWPSTGRCIVITEGEIDALSYSEARPSWPVVSVPNGAQGAYKALSKHIEFFEGYDEIVLAFDNDEPGQEAARKCAELFTPGKAKVASLNANYKDFNEALVAGDKDAIVHAIFNAKSVKPDGIHKIEDLIAEIEKPLVRGLPWFDEKLNEELHGRRYGETIGIGAGTGVGKTDLITQQVAYDVIELGLKVATLFFEQSNRETGRRVAGKIAHRTFHIEDTGWTPEELAEAIRSIPENSLYLYDSFGQTDWSDVKSVIRHLRFSEGVRVFYLDHLTALADTKDEKGSLEEINRQMSMLAQELDIIIVFVSHLTTPDGTPHEEGGRVMIRHFKGSRSIGFWAHTLLGLERDQQAEDPIERTITTIRILKHRHDGSKVGTTINFGYDTKAGRLVHADHGSFAELKPAARDEDF